MASGLAGVLLSIAVAIGPNGYLIRDQLAAADLPLERLGRSAPGWWVVFHDQESWGRAFYGPPELDVAVLGVLAAASPAGRSIDRLLPALRVPRLFLYAPYYRDGDRLRPLDELAVDVAETYLHAVLEASLEGEAKAIGAGSGSGGSEFLRSAALRAEEILPDVPQAQRLEAYLTAVQDFASHLLSIAHEIRRAERRARERGGSLCHLLDPPQTLFALWSKSVAETVYRGRYREAPEGVAQGSPVGAGPALRSTRRGLDAVDKTLVLDELLGGVWTGNVVRDFRWLCPAP